AQGRRAHAHAEPAPQHDNCAGSPRHLAREGQWPPILEGRRVPLLRRGPQIDMDSAAAGLGRLRGLACDAEGELFATAAQGPDGRTALLLGSAARGSAGGRGASVVLRPAPACPALGDDGPLDLSILGCGGGGECAALVLPRGAQRLVACPLVSPALGNNTAGGGGASEGTGAAAGAGLATNLSRASRTAAARRSPTTRTAPAPTARGSSSRRTSPPSASRRVPPRAARPAWTAWWWAPPRGAWC
ncbi:unnamed protein product, partial [Prorocentrum cordatum]